MNYRHQFHAGNFADVMKHVLLVRLIRALQKKPKGFLVLDTHAGRGSYDLALASTGDSLARRPEWPDGVGRLAVRGDLPEAVADYVALVKSFDAGRRGGAAADGLPRFYPGSPWLAQAVARPQERLAFCERHPVECAALRGEFQFSPGVQVREIDGYEAVRAMLPPPERRALVLIDPPFEAADEFVQVTAALRDGLRRLPGGIFAVWYPLTERARVEEFFTAVKSLAPPATLVAELTIAGDGAVPKLKGCGLLVVNPPWQFEREAGSARLPGWRTGAVARRRWPGQLAGAREFLSAAERRMGKPTACSFPAIHCPSIMVEFGWSGMPFSPRVSMPDSRSMAAAPTRSGRWSIPASQEESGQFIVIILGREGGGTSASMLAIARRTLASVMTASGRSFFIQDLKLAGSISGPGCSLMSGCTGSPVPNWLCHAMAPVQRYFMRSFQSWEMASPIRRNPARLRARQTASVLSKWLGITLWSRGAMTEGVLETAENLDQSKARLRSVARRRGSATTPSTPRWSSIRWRFAGDWKSSRFTIEKL
jgi:23S rRNA (adenine2030-N6)-methyltransferase